MSTEFAVGERRRGLFDRSMIAVERYHLLPMLERTPRSTEVVALPVAELWPQSFPGNIPFWQQSYFLKDPLFLRQALDPATGELREWYGFVGHREGKCIVRTEAAVQAFDAHCWTRLQGRTFPKQVGFTQLNTKRAGGLLHYMIVDSHQWREKYRKLSHEPATWKAGRKDAVPKQCWKEAASSMSAEAAEGYFQRWVASSGEKLNHLVRDNVVERHEVVERVLHEIGVVDGNHISLPPARETGREVLEMPECLWDGKDDRGIVRTGTRVRYEVADLWDERICGARRVEFDGVNCFRWSEPTLDLCVDVPVSDYRVTIHLQPGQPWKKRAIVSLDGRPVPTRDLHIGSHELSLTIHAGDFGTAKEHVLTLDFPKVVRRFNGVPNDCGAALAAVTFDRIACAAPAAA